MKNAIINNKIELIQQDDNIYIYKALEKSVIDIETVKEITRLGDEWNGTTLCANLLDFRDVQFIDSNAREYGAEQYRAHVAGQAILIESKISYYFANIFLKFSQPKVPTKLFIDKSKALIWLKDQMSKLEKNP